MDGDWIAIREGAQAAFAVCQREHHPDLDLLKADITCSCGAWRATGSTRFLQWEQHVYTACGDRRVLRFGGPSG